MILISSPGGCLVEDLAQLMNVRCEQTRRTLNTLATFGLAAKVRKGVWEGQVRSLEHLNQIAEELGVSGASAAQREIHRKERIRRNKHHGNRVTRNSALRSRGSEREFAPRRQRKSTSLGVRINQLDSEIRIGRK